MKLPPEEMSKTKHVDMFADPSTKLHLSLQVSVSIDVLYFRGVFWGLVQPQAALARSKLPPATKALQGAIQDVQ